MKSTRIVLIFIALFVGCRKDNNPDDGGDTHRTVTGKAVDMQTGAPMPGVGVYIYQKFWVGPLNDEGHWSYKTLDSTATDVTGAFSLGYYLNSYGQLAADFFQVASTSIPAEYQQTVVINDNADCLYYKEGIALFESSYFKIQVIPRTWVRFRLPTIPAAWADDTLFLRVGNICKENACGCFPYKDFAIAFQHPDEMQDFQQQIWETAYGNKVSLDYKVKGKNVEFVNYFQTECPWRDTTAVLITF